MLLECLLMPEQIVGPKLVAPSTSDLLLLMTDLQIVKALDTTAHSGEDTRAQFATSLSARVSKTTGLRFSASQQRNRKPVFAIRLELRSAYTRADPQAHLKPKHKKSLSVETGQFHFVAVCFWRQL